MLKLEPGLAEYKADALPYPMCYQWHLSFPSQALKPARQQQQRIGRKGSFEVLTPSLLSPHVPRADGEHPLHCLPRLAEAHRLFALLPILGEGGTPGRNEEEEHQEGPGTGLHWR